MSPRSKEVNLNRLWIEDHNAGAARPLEDPGCEVAGGRLAVYFRDVEAHLLRHIREADYVVGCVAWLTSEPILSALAGRRGVSLVVQKEDFLRPDVSRRGGWARRLRGLYERLPSTDRREYGGDVVPLLSVAEDGTLPAVRCVGNHNAQRAPAFPRSHHKFVCFCRKFKTADTYEPFRILPYAAWTGSFNFTANSANSLENAVYVRSRKVALAFYREWGQVLALSQPLDWTCPWVEPQWRIGT